MAKRITIVSVFRFLITLLLGVMVFLLISRSINIQDAAQTLGNFSLGFIFGSIIFSLAIAIVKAVRFYFLIDREETTSSFLDFITVFFTSQSVNTPGGNGYKAQLKLESNTKTIRLPGPGTAQAIIDTTMAILIVVVGSFFYRIFFSVFIVFCLLLAIGIIFIFSPRWLKRILNLMSRRWNFVRSCSYKIIRLQTEVQKILFIKKHPHVSAFHIICLGFLADILGAFFISFAASMLGFSLTFFPALFLYALGVAIQGIFSIVPFGIGVTEGGMLGLLTLWDIPNSHAMLLIISFRIWTLVFPLVLGVVILIALQRKLWLSKGYDWISSIKNQKEILKRIHI